MNDPKSWNTLMVYGERWVRAFLGMEINYFKTNYLELPIQFSNCVINYTEYLKGQRVSGCCGRNYCPIHRIKLVVLSIKQLPEEIKYFIFSFICYN